MKMKKNYYALRLAGLLNEQAGPPMGGQDVGGMDAQGGGQDAGGEQDQPEDPAALVDQAIEILNKLKDALGGAGGGAGPDQGAEQGGQAAPPQGGGGF